MHPGPWDGEDNPGLLVLIIGMVIGAITIGACVGLMFLARWIFS